MTTTAEAPVLVTGATGTQGGSVARALLARGRRVRILTRSVNKPAAQALAAAGVEVVRGDFDDAGSVHASVRGVAGVFSMQQVAAPGTDNERKHGLLLVEAARKAGVPQFVHTSVSAAGTHTRFPRWGTGYWSEKYWTDKWEIEEAVRGAGFPSWTVLKPAFIMENFIPPKVDFMFPHLRQGKIATALRAGTRLQLVTAEDVGSFAGTAFEDKARLHGESIDLAAEALTMSEVAAVFSKVLGKRIEAVELTPEQALQAGLSSGWVRSQEWSNEVSYAADIPSLKRYGIPMSTLQAWAVRHKTEFVVGS